MARPERLAAGLLQKHDGRCLLAPRDHGESWKCAACLLRAQESAGSRPAGIQLRQLGRATDPRGPIERYVVALYRYECAREPWTCWRDKCRSAPIAGRYGVLAALHQQNKRSLSSPARRVGPRSRESPRGRRPSCANRALLWSRHRLLRRPPITPNGARVVRSAARQGQRQAPRPEFDRDLPAQRARHPR